jgi:hypothetical protein
MATKAYRDRNNWPPYNVKAIVNNVKLVFKTRDINKLNGTAYRFITLYHGFIAHYDLGGFRNTYQGLLTQLAKNLLTSEGYSSDMNYNYKAARQHLLGHWADQGGMAYQKSVGDAMLGIIAVADNYLRGK